MSTSHYIYRERAGNGPGAPLLFLFHGTGGDEDQFFDIGGQLLPGARLVAVRGDVSERGMLRYFRRTGEGVYDMDDLAYRTGRMAAFIAAHVGESRPAAVYGLGYSNGANILAAVLFAHPELVDSAVLMHPLIPFTPPPAPGLKGRRVLITAGRHDPIAPAGATEGLAAWLAGQGVEVALEWQPGGHELGREEFAAARRFLTASPASVDADPLPAGPSVG
jgi:phospholipase/carboxylesterase